MVHLRSELRVTFKVDDKVAFFPFLCCEFKSTEGAECSVVDKPFVVQSVFQDWPRVDFLFVISHRLEIFDY